MWNNGSVDQGTAAVSPAYAAHLFAHDSGHTFSFVGSFRLAGPERIFMRHLAPAVACRWIPRRTTGSPPSFQCGFPLLTSVRQAETSPGRVTDGQAPAPLRLGHMAARRFTPTQFQLLDKAAWVAASRPYCWIRNGVHAMQRRCSRSGLAPNESARRLRS